MLEVGFIVNMLSISFPVNHRVIDRVLISYIHCNLVMSLVFDSSYIYVSFGAFGKFPIGLPLLKMGYFNEVECPSNNRYI